MIGRVFSKRWRTAWLSLALAILSFVSVFVAQKDSGVARDEIDYMVAGSRYASFWTDFFQFKDGVTKDANITKHFGGKAATANNREHPPLLKTMFGFSHRWFHKKLGWTSSLSAYRLPTVLFNAVLVVLIFVFASRLWGDSVGLIAALLTLCMPRAFFHAGLATFDAAVVTMWIATVFAYYKALESRRWCIVLGVVYGLALATKHNAIILPVPLLVHYVAIAYLAARREGGGRSFKAVFSHMLAGIISKQPLILAALVVIGPLVLVAVWPWLWFDTATHAREWLGFHTDHVHYNFEYLGRNWNNPPFPVHVPIVTTLFTVPVVTLLGAAIGTVWVVMTAWQKRAISEKTERTKEEGEVKLVNSPALLLFLSAGAAMGPFILRSTPIFGAEKHFAAAFPTFAIYAGLGVVFAARLFATRARTYVSSNSRFARHVEPAMIVFLGFLVVGAAAIETRDAQPYGLSHYNALAGGAPGGADFGMNRQFWGVSSRGVLGVLNDYAETVAPDVLTVYAHDADKTFGVYKELGLLARNVRVGRRELAGIRASSVAIVIHERHFNRHDYLIWEDYGTVAPAFVLRSDGVPLVSVYARPAKPPTTPAKSNESGNEPASGSSAPARSGQAPR